MKRRCGGYSNETLYRRFLSRGRSLIRFWWPLPRPLSFDKNQRLLTSGFCRESGYFVPEFRSYSVEQRSEELNALTSTLMVVDCSDKICSHVVKIPFSRIHIFPLISPPQLLACKPLLIIVLLACSSTWGYTSLKLECPIQQSKCPLFGNVDLSYRDSSLSILLRSRS